MTRSLGATAALLVSALLVGCAAAPSTSVDTLAPLTGPVRGEPLQESAPPVPGSIDTDVAGDHLVLALEQYPTMAWLLSASGVLAEIGRRPVTILAPSELAFRDFAAADMYGVMQDPVLLAPMLRRHVIVGVYDPATLALAGTVTNLAGERMAVWRNGAQVVVDDVTLSPPTTENSGTSLVYGANRLLLSPAGSG